MCNIAGYIGNRRAAPILIDMMSRESGFGGGYYTGIATIHEGKLHYRKVVGDVDRLLSETDAIDLPGNIGFIHSRSYGTQNVEWSHPFISDNDKMAYICNGIGGDLDTKEQIEATANSLVAEGFKFRSAFKADSGYLRTVDDMAIHNSEIVAHLIASKYRKEGNFGRAMMHAMLERPSEIVGLAMHVDHPDTIFVTKFNKPMAAARADGEMFLATTSMVFPKDRKYISMEHLPYLSLSEVTQNGFKVTEYESIPRPVKMIDAKMYHDAYSIIYEALKDTTEETALSVWDLADKCKALWDSDKLTQDAALTYETIRAIDDEYGLKIAKIVKDGAAEGIKTTQFKLYMN